MFSASIFLLLPMLFASLASTSKPPSSLFSETLKPNLKLDGSLANNFYPPEDVPGPPPLKAWSKAYHTAKSQGLIPSISPSVLSDGRLKYPHYSDHVLSDPKAVCSWTISECNSRNDIRTAPHGKMGISFDDGPQKPTSKLLLFLRQHNQTATHFLIGSRILDNPKILIEAYRKNQDHLAVHTWSHPYMTTMTDEQVLGEIGWTMQIIYDLTGIVPAFWRPPYGDVDNRVRAISQHVFGLKTVMWSVDPNDWCLSDNSSPGSECVEGSGPQNIHQLTHVLKYQVLQGMEHNKFPKNGIISLEHELSQRTVKGFMNMYPLAVSLGWDTKSIPDLFGLKWYQQPLSNSSNGGKLSEPDSSNVTGSTIPFNTSNSSGTFSPVPQGNETGVSIVPTADLNQTKSIPEREARGTSSTLKPSLDEIYLACLNAILLIYIC